MDFKEFFNPTTLVQYNFNDKIVRHYFAEMDSETDLHYQRMVAKATRAAINNTANVPDNVLNSEIWLYNKLCQKVEVQNGAGFVEVEDFRGVISPAMKRRAIFDYQRRISDNAKQEEGTEGNQGNS